MAAAIPTGLKSADIGRFAHRAGQLEKAKPVVAYWCNYWIVEQILKDGLHHTDAECMSYTMGLVDGLEQTKSAFKDDDTVVDDMAARAYIEQFADETFQRGVNAMKANRATRQTADTLQASATFLELGRIWGSLDAEVASKIKFAKFHALRIAKALKAGEDPNASNPAPEPEPLPIGEQPDRDFREPDLQMLGDLRNQNNGPLQPSVEDVPDGQDGLEPHPAPTSSYDKPFQMPRAPSQPQPLSPPEPGEDYYNNTTAPEVSPLAPTSADQTISEGGGYFPQVPDGVGHAHNSLPDASPAEPGSPPEQFVPQAPGFPPPASTPPFPVPSAPPTNSMHHFPPPNVINDDLPAPGPVPPFHPPHPVQAQPYVVPGASPQTPAQHTMPPASAPIRQAPPHRVLPPTLEPAAYRTDEEAVVAAQRHARFAISALNFEDVKTAVKELRDALQSLGAG